MRLSTKIFLGVCLDECLPRKDSDKSLEHIRDWFRKLSMVVLSLEGLLADFLQFSRVINNFIFVSPLGGNPRLSTGLCLHSVLIFC